MKILIYLGHPAHFHLFKNIINKLKEDGNQVIVTIKTKDILKDLLIESGFDFISLSSRERRGSKIQAAIGFITSANCLKQVCLKDRPDIMVGTSVEMPIIGRLLRIPSINFNEDDANYEMTFCKVAYPPSSLILAPVSCDCGKWEYKTIKYASYHELAYLHPNNFKPDRSIVEKYFSVNDPYFIVRLVKFKAIHDEGMKGINDSVADKIINMLSPYGRVYITSEGDLSARFDKYKIHIKPIDMHHILAFSSLYIGDSQTMAVEAGMLGVPFIRYNDFVGIIAILKEIEDHYLLGYGIKTGNEDKLYSTIKMILEMPNRKEVFQERRRKMLSEKIDAAQFFTWFIENYPESEKIMRSNPDYQYRFR